MNKTSVYIRRILALSVTLIYLIVGLLSAQYPDYIEIFKAMTIPEGIVLAFYFGNNLMAKHKGNDKSED
jgi:hypothetical protein